MAQIIETVFQLRKGTAEEWKRSKYILEAGEPGWSTNTKILKIGDGAHVWNELPPIFGIEIDPNKYWTIEEIKAFVKEINDSLTASILKGEEHIKALESEIPVLSNDIKNLAYRIKENEKTLQLITDETAGILAQAMAYTDGVLAASSMRQIDNNTLQMKDGQVYVAKVSTDILEQGEMELILMAGSSI